MRQKAFYIVHNLKEAANTTPYQRVALFSRMYDLLVLLERNTVPGALSGKAGFLVNPVRKARYFRTFFYPLWCLYTIFRMRRQGMVVITSYQPLPLITGFAAKALFRAAWVADVYDVPGLDLEVAGQALSFRFFLHRRYFAALNVVTKRILKMSDMVLCALVPEALSDYRIPAGKLVHLTNGVDLAAAGGFFSGPAASGHRLKKEGFFTVLYVGFVLRIRGAGTILESARMLGRKYPGIRWVLAGPSSARETKWLTRAVSSFGLRDAVEFTGEVSHDVALGLIRDADVCLFTFPRNFATDYIYPIKLFEYMALGKPVIATGLKGIREVLRDGENALLIEPENPEDLARAVEKLYARRDLMERLSEGARREVPKYDWKEINGRIRAAMVRLPGEGESGH